MRLGKLESGAALNVDVSRLVDTRMLVQANSGGGKSWMLRLIAERAGIQTIVIDPEGEFASLREALDMVLVSRDGGDIPADPRSAALLARRLIEHRVSAVIDLFELKPRDRQSFVKVYLEAMVNLPKELWHPLLVIIDEVQMFCPERGEGEAESTEAVITFNSLARKRGFCPVLATQRLSKLHKDAAAELNNVVIGRTWLDNDQVRAGKILGMGAADRIALRDLAQGEFYAFGPALDVQGVVKFRSDAVKTTHPKPGSRHLMAPPAPSNAVKSILAKLADLPKQAEEEAKTIEQLREENRRLKKDLKAKSESGTGFQPVKAVPAVDSKALEAAGKRGYQAGIRELGATCIAIRKDTAEADQYRARAFRIVERNIADAKQALDLIAKCGGNLHNVRIHCDVAQKVRSRTISSDAATRSAASSPSNERPKQANPEAAQASACDFAVDIPADLTKYDREVLKEACKWPEGRTEAQLAVLAARSRTSSTWQASIARLKRLSLLDLVNGILIPTDSAKQIYPAPERPEGGEALRAYWSRRLNNYVRHVFETLCAAGGGVLSVQELASNAGCSLTSSTFQAAVADLKRLGIAQACESGIKAPEALFD